MCNVVQACANGIRDSVSEGGEGVREAEMEVERQVSRERTKTGKILHFS